MKQKTMSTKKWIRKHVIIFSITVILMAVCNIWLDPLTYDPTELFGRDQHFKPSTLLSVIVLIYLISGFILIIEKNVGKDEKLDS